MANDPETGPAYRFKWAGYDLDRWRANCRARSDKLRRDAELLIIRAQQIDSETDELLAALKAVEKPDVE